MYLHLLIYHLISLCECPVDSMRISSLGNSCSDEQQLKLYYFLPQIFPYVSYTAPVPISHTQLSPPPFSSPALQDRVKESY